MAYLFAALVALNAAYLGYHIAKSTKTAVNLPDVPIDTIQRHYPQTLVINHT